MLLFACPARCWKVGREVRHSPILVVCCTNHALDQFLEGIFKFCERIARIGSRSSSEIMKSRNLKELTMEVQPSWSFIQARRGLIERRDKLREQFSSLMDRVNSHSLDVDSAREILGDKVGKSRRGLAHLDMDFGMGPGSLM